MQILYVNSDSISARQLHAEFLSYRGFVWDLLHCQSAREAVQQLDDKQFDVLLYESAAEPQQIRTELEDLSIHCGRIPIVAVIRDLDPAEELFLYELGVHDTVSERCIDGPYIMRRLRMAQARASKGTGPIALSNLRRISSDGSQPLRLLIVEAQDSFHDLHSQLGRLSNEVEIHSATGLTEASKLLSEKNLPFDGVFVDQGALENQQSERLKKVRRSMQQIPFVMLLLDRSDFTAVSFIEQGFADCLIANCTTIREVAFSIQKSLARISSQFRQLRAEIVQCSAPVSERRSRARKGSNRRTDARYVIELPVRVYAVLPDGAPDTENIYDARTSDISLRGIGFKIPLLDRLPGRNWLIGVLPDCDPHTANPIGYINAILRHVKYEPDGIQIGAKFERAEELFQRSRLEPKVDNRNNQINYGLPREVLDRWVDLNVLSRRISQRAKACPECHAVVTVGDGCSQCGSADIDYRVLIHHFACAWVDDSSQFQRDRGISCPKCLTSDLIVGADFELIKSRYQCEDCDYEGGQTELVCSCFNCLLRFPLRLAQEVEIYRYDVQRLDVLDILDSAK